MHLSQLLLPLALALTSATSVAAAHGPNKDGKYEIASEGIRAQFIPYGASISNLFIKDKHGVERDIVMGFDNASYYSVDKLHPHLGGVPGRYANRIKNSTFTIDGTKYDVLPNEHGGRNTLHGGPHGWDWRNFTVEDYNKDSITFGIVDPAGSQGFPGKVISYITYMVTPMEWHFKMVAISTDVKTPIMLSSHVYWNLDGFQNPHTDTALNHSFHLPYSGQRIAVDGNLIPTGTILSNKRGGVNDWWSQPKQIGEDIFKNALRGNCGTDCQGYDNAYLVNRAQNGPYDWRTEGPVASLSSDWSGIKVDVYSDQDAFQMYSCNGMDDTFAVKKTQGFFGNPKRPRTVPMYGCVVMEVEDWIDAINNPAWQRDQRNVFGPGDGPYVIQATHKFSVK